MASDNACSEEVFEEAGNLFTHSYIIIKTIIKYLGYADLLIVSQLSKTWQHIVNQHLQKQRKCLYLTIHAPTESTIKQSPFARCANAEQDVNYILENFISRCSGKNGLVLGFENGGWMNKPLTLKASPIAATLQKQLKTVLGKRGNYSLMCGRGLIGSAQANSTRSLDPSVHNDINKMLDLQNRPGSSAHCPDTGPSPMYINTPDYIAEIDDDTSNPSDLSPISMVFIPEQYGVHIKLINFNSKVFTQIMRPNSKSVADKKFNELCDIKENDELKAFMYISTEFDSREKNFLTSLLSRRDKFAFGGGLVAQIQGLAEEPTTSFGIAVSGRNVNATSIVIPQTVFTKNTVDKYIQELKSARLPEGNSIAFLFSCCGRGESWYKRDHTLTSEDCGCVETACFRRHFPHTPLFGFYGDGEFGHNHPPLQALAPVKKRRTNPLMSYSAVLVLISIL